MLEIISVLLGLCFFFAISFGVSIGIMLESRKTMQLLDVSERLLQIIEIQKGGAIDNKHKI